MDNQAEFPARLMEYTGLSHCLFLLLHFLTAVPISSSRNWQEWKDILICSHCLIYTRLLQSLSTTGPILLTWIMFACPVLIRIMHCPLNQLKTISSFCFQNSVVLSNNICEITSSNCYFYFLTSASKHTNYNKKRVCGPPHSIFYTTGVGGGGM